MAPKINTASPLQFIINAAAGSKVIAERLHNVVGCEQIFLDMRNDTSAALIVTLPDGKILKDRMLASDAIE